MSDITKEQLEEVLRATTSAADVVMYLYIELAKTVVAYDAAIKECADDPEKMASFCTAENETLDTLYSEMLKQARPAVIAWEMIVGTQKND
jgi:hypothetical protein